MERGDLFTWKKDGQILSRETEHLKYAKKALNCNVFQSFMR